MSIFNIVLMVLLGLSVAFSVALWTTAKEMKAELEFYGEQSTDN